LSQANFVSAQTDTEFWVVVPEINDTHVSSWADEPHKGAPGIFRFTTFDLASTVTLSLPADPTFIPLAILTYGSPMMCR